MQVGLWYSKRMTKFYCMDSNNSNGNGRVRIETAKGTVGDRSHSVWELVEMDVKGAVTGEDRTETRLRADHWSKLGMLRALHVAVQRNRPDSRVQQFLAGSRVSRYY